MGGLFGGGKKQAAPAAPAGGADPSAKLFTPEQVTKITGDYTNKGLSKWGQILSNMGAAGGTGGPDLSTAIGGQAKDLGTALSGLTASSGYGSDGMGQLDAILRGVEPGINPKYSVYG